MGRAEICTHVNAIFILDMAWRHGNIVAMYIDVIPNRGSPPAVLLREAKREGDKIRKRTLCNLSDWPAERIDIFRRLLRGERLVPLAERLRI